MSFFNSEEPFLRPKQSALDIQDRIGLWQIHLKLGRLTLLSRFYTRIDQIFVIWGSIAAGIFFTAQFAPISWLYQAALWSSLTLIGIVGMTSLAWFWVSVERLRWVVVLWAGLMALGVLLTDLGIVLSWWRLLMNLCPMWLALSGLGYVITGLGMRSRTFLVTGLAHLLGIGLLPHVGGWQFAATGALMAGSLLFLSEVQWDMRSPIEFKLLTTEQIQFNQEQHRLRRLLP